MINTSVQEMVDRIEGALRVAHYSIAKYGRDHHESTGRQTRLISIEIPITFARRFVSENKENPE